MKKLVIAAVALGSISAFAIAAEPVGTNRVLNEFESGSVTTQEGLTHLNPAGSICPCLF